MVFYLTLDRMCQLQRKEYEYCLDIYWGPTENAFSESQFCKKSGKVSLNILGFILQGLKMDKTNLACQLHEWSSKEMHFRPKGKYLHCKPPTPEDFQEYECLLSIVILVLLHGCISLGELFQSICCASYFSIFSYVKKISWQNKLNSHIPHI